MSDVKDILGVPRGGAAEKQEKPKEQKLVKPKGMSREAFALLSATHPLVPSDLVNELGKKADKKDKPKKRGQVTFQWQAFTNPARTDTLQLEHWVKCYKDANGNVTPADQGEYPFAKYNKHTKIYKYDDEEWNTLIAADPDWSREETDYLLTMVEQYDCRWMAITDRYQFPNGAAARSIEDLKGRYYSVARQLLVGREGGPDTVANNVLVKHPYSAQAERERKQGLELLFKRTPQQDAEEEEVLQEAMKIEAKRRAESGYRRGGGGAAGAATPAAAAPAPIVITEFTNDVAVGTPPLFDNHANPALPTLPADKAAENPNAPIPRVVARVSHTRDIIAATIEGIEPAKTQKAVEGSMAELKMPDLPRSASRAVCGAYISLVREVMELMELKRQLATKAAGKRGRAAGDDVDGDVGGGKRARTAGRREFE